MEGRREAVDLGCGVSCVAAGVNPGIVIVSGRTGKSWKVTGVGWDMVGPHAGCLRCWLVAREREALAARDPGALVCLADLGWRLDGSPARSRLGRIRDARF